MGFLNKEKLLSTTDFDFANKTVLVRVDADVDLKQGQEGELVVDEDFRLKTVLPTLRLLFERGIKKAIIVGHIGRPNGSYKKDLGLQPVADWFSAQDIGQVCFVEYQAMKDLSNLKSTTEDRVGNLVVLDSIRFFKEEKENDKGFISTLASLADVYVNEAFGVAHRNQSSITGLPKIMPSFAGLRLEAEVETLSHVKQKTTRPLVCVLGGSKPGKLGYIPFLGSWADRLLVGGKLPTLIKEEKFEIDKSKVVLADLTENGRDISISSIEKFKQEIKKAGSVFWAGPMGVYEEEKNRRGTTEVVEFISKMDVFKVAGGGDTHRVLSWLDCWDCFDFVSVGGGSALQFLKDESLPGLEALK